VGARIKSRRNVLGLTQQYLSQRLGVSGQQVQKYEAGITRLDASSLFKASRILQVPIDFFFERTDACHARGANRDETNDGGPELDYLLRQDIIDLVTAYYAIENAQIRRRLFELVKSLWQNDNADLPVPRKRKRLQHAASLVRQQNALE
jgi:transcriptional regulator with XRE-family HTH domain